MSEPLDFREMEMLCRHRAVFDRLHRTKWLREARRWRVLLHRETALRFHTAQLAPMSMGANTMGNQRQFARRASQYDRRKTPLDSETHTDKSMRNTARSRHRTLLKTRILA
jgi:hypothetical protein